MKGQKKHMEKTLKLQYSNSNSSTLDEELLLRTSQGDMQAFHELYTRNSKSVYGFALSITKSTHDAEDVLQDTFVAIFGNAATYSPQGKPLAWILTIARNLSLMKLREKTKTQSFDELELDNDSSFSHIENNDDRLVLESALSILDSEERQIVMLHSMTGLKNREISKLLDLPIGTVLSKYHRALKKMRNYLQGDQK